jgi:hypothetical protein
VSADSADRAVALAKTHRNTGVISDRAFASGGEVRRISVVDVGSVSQQTEILRLTTIRLIQLILMTGGRAGGEVRPFAIRT